MGNLLYTLISVVLSVHFKPFIQTGEMSRTSKEGSERKLPRFILYCVCIKTLATFQTQNIYFQYNLYNSVLFHTNIAEIIILVYHFERYIRPGADKMTQSGAHL